MDGTTTLAAGTGVALRLAAGERIAITNREGTQVVDFWALDAGDPGRASSMPHSRNVWYRLGPQVGDVLVTQWREPIVTLVEDTSPGVHDTLIPCCDVRRYAELGVTGPHRSCAANFAEALAELGVASLWDPPPAPLNLFMNVTLRQNGTLGIAPPASRKGDRVAFRAERDCIVVLSACPYDLPTWPLNGIAGRPTDVGWRVDR